MKVGKISYNQKKPFKTLSLNQLNLSEKVANEIIKMGLNAKICYDSSTIDVEVLADTKTSGLNKGIFRVFWSSNGNNKIQYLCFGLGHFDGYEIKRKWTNDIETSEVANTLKQDLERYNKLTK